MKATRTKLKNKELLKHPKGSIFEEGYGQISKKAMKDKRLSIEAKAIYAYLCSYCGGGNTAYPTRDRICQELNISVNRYYRHMEQLTEIGYIKILEMITEGNRFANNIYEISYKVK